MRNNQTNTPLDTRVDDEQPASADHPSTSSSRPGRIAALAIGETESIAKRIDFDLATKEVVATMLSKLKGTLSAAAGRAKVRTGHRYVLEVGDMRTRDGDILVVAAVTRIA